MKSRRDNADIVGQRSIIEIAIYRQHTLKYSPPSLTCRISTLDFQPKVSESILDRGGARHEGGVRSEHCEESALAQ
jgi:hypothetical protein